MKKFMLFFILILPFGCAAATSTEQLEQTSQAGKAPAVSQELSKQQPEAGEAEESSGIKVQKILDGRPVYSRSEDKVSSGEEGLKLAEPAPETLKRPWSGTQKTQSHVESLGTRSSSSKRRPWSSVWHAPIVRSSPSIGEETSSQTIEPPASWDDYKEVDFGKFASGSYVSDYANKYLKIKCRFSSVGSEFVEIPKYPRPDYVTFIVTGINSQLRSISVVVSRPQADAVFKLKPQKEIVLYGKAVRVDLHTLTMEVLKIER